MNQQTEEWRPVVGYTGRYEVSDLGRVRSLRFRNRLVDAPRTTPKYLKPFVKLGYPFVGLPCGSRQIHRLVLEAFLGPCPEGMEAAHLNGIRSDCRAVNLKWTTRKENHSHKIAHGTAQRGENHGFAVLSNAQVIDIRQRRKHGEKLSALAGCFGVSETTICDIAHRRTWRHV